MNFFSNITDSINRILSDSFIRPWLIIVLLVLAILWLYFFMTMKLGKFSQKIEKKVSYQYDNILYLWSIYYDKHFDALKSNPGLIVFKAIIWSGKPKYIPNRKLIKETILKIENKIWTKVIPDEEWKKLSKLLRKYQIRHCLSILLKSVIILVIVILFLLLILVALN